MFHVRGSSDMNAKAMQVCANRGDLFHLTSSIRHYLCNKVKLYVGV